MVRKLGLYLFFAKVNLILQTNLLICALSQTPKKDMSLFKLSSKSTKFYFSLNLIIKKELTNIIYNWQESQIILKANFDYNFYTFFKQMTQTQILTQLKFKISSLESNLVEKQKIIDQYKFIESQADAKIKGMQKIHAEKIKSLLNSISILKKEKASIQGLSKQHKRSKLIEQLNKQINDQDLVIQILRKQIYDEKGKQEGRALCDNIIVKALNKGPERIRPATRQELRQQIEKLTIEKATLQSKIKQSEKKTNGQRKVEADETMSQISSVLSNESNFEQNKNEELLNKMRNLQIEVQGLKLESNSKNKIIQKLKVSVLQGQKYKSQVQLLKNEIEIANRKVFSFQRILKESKQATNKKLIDLYERELKVQELQMIGQQKSDKLKSMNQTHSIILQQLQAQKEQLQVKLQQIKQQNEKIILQNITNKKYQQNQKAKIEQIKVINEKQKQNLSSKLKQYEEQVQRFIEQNQKLKRTNTQMSNDMFEEKALWVEEKQKYLEEIEALKYSKDNNQKLTDLMVQVDRLKDQNRRLQEAFATGTGTGTGSDTMLLKRLQAYKKKVQYYQSKGNKSKQMQAYNDLFDKYNKLLEEFMQYKNHQQKGGQDNKKRKDRKQIIDLTLKQKKLYEDLSSGIDELNLSEVDSQVLDNFNTSYEYSIHLDQNGKQTKVPKVSQADKELLKLINSDLWYFIKDDELAKKIEQVSNADESNAEDQVYISQQMKRIRNLSHPQGQKIKIYEEELGRLDLMSDGVSVTSALGQQINKFDSDVDVEFEKINKHAPKNLNYNQLKNLNLEIGSDVQVSSAESGQSSLKRKKKAPIEKASKLKFNSKGSINSLEMDSELSEDLMNSDVSSVNIGEKELQRIDSDVQTDFRKKKIRP